VTRLPSSQQTCEQTAARRVTTLSLHWAQLQTSSVQRTPGTWWRHARPSAHFQPANHKQSNTERKNVVLPSHAAHRVALISIFWALSQTPVYTAKPGLYGASASRGVPVYVPAFTGTNCAYPRRDGQAGLTWVAGYMPRWFTCLQTVTHPSTNRGRRWLTSLMRPTTLPTEPNRHSTLNQLIKQSINNQSINSLVSIDGALGITVATKPSRWFSQSPLYMPATKPSINTFHQNHHCHQHQ